MGLGYGEFDPKHHVCLIAGILIEGYGEESAIDIEPNSDHRSHKTSVDGLVVSSKLHDETATLTITLLETSASHRALMALLKLDKATPGGAGVGSFELRDLINGEVNYSEKCWIQRRPNKVVGKEAAEYEWKFTLGNWETDFD